MGDNKRADFADVGDGRGEASDAACDTGYVCDFDKLESCFSSLTKEFNMN